jgi:death on curing protein
LHSVIEHVKNDDYYPELEHKLTHLTYSINKNHSFRTAIKEPLLHYRPISWKINNCSFSIPRFITEMEIIAVDVAENRIDKDLLFEIISSIVYEEDFSEELKLKIINAKGFANTHEWN